MLWIQGLHVIFVVTWFAGLFYLPRIFVYYAQADDPATKQTLCINAGPAGMSSSDPDKHAGWVVFDVNESGDVTKIIKVHLSSEGETIRETVDLSKL
mgnify:CR=1 FL=1